MVFISYSHADERYLQRLLVHLRPLERDIGIEVWADTKLAAGDRWREDIAKAIPVAQIAILLVSADFLASEFIATNELPPLLQAAERGGLTVLPVIISACRFTSTPDINCFQAVNDPTRPIASMPYAEKEAFWARVAQSVEALCEGRLATEGWAVANERIVREAIRRLVESRVNKAYLIVGSGDYYIQFKHYPANDILYCETVSDYYLPENSGLTKRAADRLLQMGFEEGNKSSGYNYHRRILLTDGNSALQQVAAMAVEILRDAYKVSQRSNVDIKFGSEDGNWPE